MNLCYSFWLLFFNSYWWNMNIPTSNFVMLCWDFRITCILCIVLARTPSPRPCYPFESRGDDLESTVFRFASSRSRLSIQARRLRNSVNTCCNDNRISLSPRGTSFGLSTKYYRWPISSEVVGEIDPKLASLLAQCLSFSQLSRAWLVIKTSF